MRFESTAGFGKPTTAQKVTTEPIRFSVKLPPGAEGLSTVLTTTDLTVKEQWHPQPGPTDVGKAFIRTITIEANDVPGMAIPPFRFDPPEGLRAYPRAPVVEDRVNRGELVGRRVDRVTYVCERPGDYSIPPMKLSWWHPTEKKLHEAKLPGIEIKVSGTLPTPSETSASPHPEKATRRWWPALIPLAVGLGMGGYFLLRRRQEHGEREREAFRDFCRACDRDIPEDVFRALERWIDVAHAKGRVVTLAEFRDRWRETRLTQELTTLETLAFAGKPASGPKWSPRLLRESVERVRREALRPGESRAVAVSLPPLNPREGTGVGTPSGKV